MKAMRKMVEHLFMLLAHQVTMRLFQLLLAREEIDASSIEGYASVYYAETQVSECEPRSNRSLYLL